jgi:hypothetical protein
MAEIDSITFSITRTSYPTGHICSIDYSYSLRVHASEPEADATFHVSAVLYGDDMLRDKHIGAPAYDNHLITVNEPMPINRSFAVPCEILDEAVGEDRIFLKIYALGDKGQVVEARSETIKDWF